MSKNLALFFGIDELLAVKEEYKNQKLKRREITDKLLQLVLDRLSVEDRYRVLYYYIMDDVYLEDS
jgi:hypothetical protein